MAGKAHVVKALHITVGQEDSRIRSQVLLPEDRWNSLRGRRHLGSLEPRSTTKTQQATAVMQEVYWGCGAEAASEQGWRGKRNRERRYWVFIRA